VIHNQDLFEGLKDLPDNSLDSMVTDPPYNLSFMGKDWDDKGAPKEFQEWNQEWGELVLDKLKPGAWICVFSGTKTYHRTASGLEDAGFEIKDQLDWIYGEGFPKSRNIWKQDVKPKLEEKLREEGVEGEIEWK